MEPETTDARLQRDLESLRSIVDGMDALQASWDRTRPLIGARQRGYFTPDEEDRARQLVLAYRNYRIGLWDIISRCLDYEELPDARVRLQTFMLGFAAGLTLYRRALHIIAAYEHEPLVRAKLNEAEPRFGLEAGFFDELITRYSSLENLRRIRRGDRFWRHGRRDLARLGLDDDGWAWVAGAIRRERATVRRLFGQVLRLRLRHNWRFVLRSLVGPVAHHAGRVTEFVGGGFAHVRLAADYRPSITTGLLGDLRRLLEPGDVLLVRGDGRLTAALLPGFWTHAAVFIDSQAALERLGLGQDPRVHPHWPGVAVDGGAFGQVIEGVAPRSTLNPLEKCLEADHVLVLRPRLGERDRREAIAEAFSHLGKPYDFEFDFRTSDRLVCTELVYRCLHRRGDIEFQLVKRLGRYTLSGDDMVQLSEVGGGAGPPPLTVVAAALKIGAATPRLLQPNELLPKLRAIRRGWRPAGARPPASPPATEA